MFSKAETVEDVLNFRPFSRKKNEYYYDFGTGNKIPIKKTETASVSPKPETPKPNGKSALENVMEEASKGFSEHVRTGLYNSAIKKERDNFLEGFNFDRRDRYFSPGEPEKPKKKSPLLQERDAFREGFLDPYGEKEKEPEVENGRYAATPKERKRLVDFNKQQLEEKRRNAVYERAFEEEQKKGNEKAFLTAILAADRDEEAKKAEKTHKKRLRELSFAKDIESEGRIMAQKEYERAYAEAVANGEDNPVVYAMEKGDAVLEKYKNLAQEARNGLYEYNINEEISKYENVKNLADFQKAVDAGRKINTFEKPGVFGNTLVENIVNVINDEDFARAYEADPEKKRDAPRILQFNEDEKDVIRYYASKGDYDAIDSYYDLLGRELDARAREKMNEKIKNFSYENPFVGSVGNVALSFLTPLSYVANAGQAIKNSITGEYEPTNTNSAMFGATHFVNESADGISDRIYDLAGGGELGENLASLTKGALSAVGDIAKIPFRGAALPLMAMDTAGRETLSALESDADPGDALLTSTAKGAVKAITEKLPQKVPIGESLQALIDNTLFKDNSEYQRNLQELRKSGLSEEEAKNRALRQTIRDVANRQIIEYIMNKTLRP